MARVRGVDRRRWVSACCAAAHACCSADEPLQQGRHRSWELQFVTVIGHASCNWHQHLYAVTVCTYALPTACSVELSNSVIMVTWKDVEPHMIEGRWQRQCEAVIENAKKWKSRKLSLVVTVHWAGGRRGVDYYQVCMLLGAGACMHCSSHGAPQHRQPHSAPDALPAHACSSRRQTAALSRRHSTS